MSSKSTKRILIVVACVVVFVGIILIGCGKQPIATVGQEKITRQEFIKKLEQDYGQDALMGMITQKLIKQRSNEQGLKIKPDDVQERLEQLKKRAGSNQRFMQTLAAQGMTEADLIDQLKLQMMVQKLCEKDVKATDANLRKFFKKHKSKFNMPRRFAYREIVVSDEKEAENVISKLEGGEAEFASLAKQHSVQPKSRQRGGKVPAAPVSRIQPSQVQSALKQLEPGEVSDPLKVGQRWYIVKLEEVKPAREATFEKDRDRILQQYKAMNSKRPQQLIQELQQNASVEIIAPKYADLNEKFKPKASLPQFGQGGPAKRQKRKARGPAAKQGPRGGSKSKKGAGRTKVRNIKPPERRPGKGQQKQ